MSRHKAGPMAADDPRHGEGRGWSAHKRRGEDPCPECWDAKRAESRGQRVRRKRRDRLKFTDAELAIPENLRPVVIGGITRWVDVA